MLRTLREPVPGARVGSSVSVVARPCPSRSESAMRKFKTVLKRTATMAPFEVDEGAGGSAPHPTEPDQRARRDNGNGVEAASMPPPPPPMRRSSKEGQGGGEEDHEETTLKQRGARQGRGMAGALASTPARASAGLAQPGKSGTTLCFENDRGLSPVWPNSSCARSTLVTARPDSPSAHPGSRA